MPNAIMNATIVETAIVPHATTPLNVSFFNRPPISQLITAPANGAKVGIVRIPAPTQLVDFTNGMLLADSIDEALDKLTMAVQWLYQQAHRSVRTVDFDASLSPIPLGTARAGRLLGFDSSGVPTTIDPATLGGSGGGGSLSISTLAQAIAGVDDTSAMSPTKVMSAITARIATTAQAQTGADNTTIMTPVAVAASIAWRISQGIATTAQAQAGADNTTIMTPLGVAQQITAKLSTTAQATAGVNTTALMTPATTAAAIAALAPTGGTALGISTLAQAIAGTDDTTAMSPTKVMSAITARIAATAVAQAGADNTLIMTPLGVAQQITAKLSTTAQANAGADNTTIMTPVMTWTAMATKMTATAATQAQAVAGTDNTTWMSPLRTAQAIAALAPSGGGTNDLNSISGYSLPINADSTGFIYVPKAGATTTLTSTKGALGSYWGPGRITMSTGRQHGRFWSVCSSYPSPAPGSYDDISTAFTGGLGPSMFQIEHYITGAATMTQPTSGYVFVPTTSAMYMYVNNDSGYNYATNGNEGRTGAAGIFIKADQYGQGDLSGITISGLAVGTKAGSTDFLANPAIVLINGGCNAGSDGVYFNPREWNHSDGGHDVACIGDVINLGRTNQTGAKSVIWTGYRVQSYGTAYVDNIFAATGKFMYGIDLSMKYLNYYSGIAIALRANDKIAFDCTSEASGNLKENWRCTAGGNYAITYNPSNPALVFAAGGNPVLQLGPTNVIINSSLKHTGTTVGFMNANPIGVYSGWGTPTNYAQVANFPGSSATLAQCGQVIGVLIYWLKLIGLFSA